ncbi:unnamed protein product [Rhizophagus irregularis]|nr:unnamed protein product [Rhizophagus irregularis]CAB5143676.1 unnamed protein product [Rhizophagus irregularis]
MTYNFDDNDTENNDSTSIIEPIDSQNSIFSLKSNIVKYESPSFKFNITTSPSLIINNILFFNNFITKFFKELLKELYTLLLDIEFKDDTDILNIFINNFLFDYDLDPKNVLEIMTSNSQNIFYYSSLIGFFYQNGIGCEVDEIKAFEIFSNSVKNNQKALLNHFTFDQKNESISFCNDDIKELNEIITQYFYSLFLYKDIILNRRNNYKFYIKNAEKGDSASQYYIGNYHYIKKDYDKAIEWYTKSSEGGNIKATYSLGVCYNFGLGIKKEEKKAFELFLKSAEGGYKYALNVVGYCYYNGYGILKDENKAFEFYLKAAKKGHGTSQYLVANWYNDGKHVLRNEEKGFYWNRKAAINGNVNAQFELAEYYIDSSINKNERKAFKWYYKLANENKVRAIYLVAKCYRDGIGIDKNLKEATTWIKKYELSKFFGKPQITLNDFLNGSDIDAFSISPFTRMCY